ncbi:MAG: enoyl-CoA hydratase/isomerase family protein [Candidatus Krumholzibacteria bacterium]|nr:enoyl-CoA hydratase/isomerase family protein [Candidatus Krumholzibacteria bacterium]
MGTSLSAKETLLSSMHSLNASPEVKVLLILNSPGVLDDENYMRFIRNAIAAKASGADRHIQSAPYSGNPLQFDRLKNTFNQFICKILSFRKLVIVGFEGDVAPPFFGASLVADYRFGTDEMTFQPSHLKLGIIPGGGLGFTLPRFVGHMKARDLLFSKKPTSASDLFRLGLLDGRFPEDKFQDECIKIANELAAMPRWAVEGVKAVINTYAPDLMNFLEYEDMTSECLIASKHHTRG